MQKSPVASKTLWTNAVAIVGVLVAHYTGMELPAEVSVGILAAVNFVLRFVTKQPVGLS